MIETYLLWCLLLLMPVEVTATNNADMEEIRQLGIQLEIDTRAYRQKITGQGL